MGWVEEKVQTWQKEARNSKLTEIQAHVVFTRLTRY